MNFPINASCQCGQVSYQLSAAPLKVIACHCQECQKLSTSPYSVTAMVRTQDIKFKGELSEWHRLAESGNKNFAKFCQGCGNRVYHYNPDDMATIKLKLKPVGAEYNAIFEPEMHVWLSEKQDWVHIPKGVACFDKQP
ncbi:GFA family protein [Vibrio sp. Isolate23]|uniref:GFA family protein n=1 Tax=Vibrio sp. Isolate23 TaxID=2908533 RepID=UPI001EFD8B31|nr:GFA family protein [Vibrio sp. Isolate23]MCG9681067.1 GFA family protein [Vibrio sp. Isolate23]